ncbi:MAG: hypothetical protein A4E54_01866 [Pelotomaculum sp. PtaB.Bin117]|nr:MAG: hypothetical protein A4E54_01866 [Pelotomaculum sp. PtaB.Bin117]
MTIGMAKNRIKIKTSKRSVQMINAAKVIDINDYRSQKAMQEKTRYLHKLLTDYEFILGQLLWTFLVYTIAEIYLRRIGW